MDVSGEPNGFDEKERAVVLDLDTLNDAAELAGKLRGAFGRVYGLTTWSNDSHSFGEKFNAVAVLKNESKAQDLILNATRQFNKIYPWQSFTLYSADQSRVDAAREIGWNARQISSVQDVLKP